MPPRRSFHLGPGFGAELRAITFAESHPILQPAVTRSDQKSARGGPARISVGRKRIDDLTAAATAPGSNHLHKWRRVDVMMWENHATMLRMVRTTITVTEIVGVGTCGTTRGQPDPGGAVLNRQFALIAGHFRQRRRVAERPGKLRGDHNRRHQIS